jgi:undecaprenyl-diphosphatase
MTTPIRSAVRRVKDAPVDRHTMVGLRLGLTVHAHVLSVWAFGGLLEEVLDDATLVHWDRVAHVWVHAHASAAGLAFFNAITILGSVGVWVVVLVAALWLWRSGHRLLLSVWLGTNVGGLLVQLALKTFVHRARPQYAAAYLHGHSYSFPSGHAMQSSVAYVMLVLVGSVASDGWRARRALLLGVAIGLAILIGISRVYLGVHYPSDVVGGFAAATAWIIASSIVLRLLDDREARRNLRGHGAARRHSKRRAA